MQYMLRCSCDQQWWEQMPAVQCQPTLTTTVPEKNGRRLTTAGACAETTKQLGGSFPVGCQDLDETRALAGRILALRTGSAIVVRPVARTCQP